LTFSTHESGRYLFPGTGFTDDIGTGVGRGTSLNLPLEPFTEDASYLAGLKAVLPKAIAAFKPDLIVLQAGADMHRFDPLSHLNLSVQGIVQSYDLVSRLADEHCGGRLIALGGGGYDPYRTVPRLWTHLWTVLSRQELPETVPEGWRKQWESKLGVSLPTRFADDTSSWPVIPHRADIAAENARTAQELLERLEPLWQKTS
jgi:acetoin utilization protein AcuC